MNILGICDNHDAGAALFSKNKITCINEERLNRQKMYQGFPELSINHLLGSQNLNPKDIDLVLIASEMTPIFILRCSRNFHKWVKDNSSIFGTSLKAYVLYQVISNKAVIPQKLEKSLSAAYFKYYFKKFGT